MVLPVHSIDNCLFISIDPEKIIQREIRKYFLMKKESIIGTPDIYLGGKVRKVELDTDTGETC